MLSKEQLNKHILITSEHLKANQFQQALAELKPLSNQSLALKSEIYLGMLASIYAQLGLKIQSKDWYQKVLELNSKNYLALFQLGMLEFEDQQLDAAAHYWSPILEQPEDFVTHHFYSYILEQKGNMQEATRLAQIAATRVPAEHPIKPQIEQHLRELVNHG